ncbi:hypothetical protein [uncultured Oceanicoccus sp.]|uniref:hypothetical protein n=1 Tax=uncultured Oceanicoccus sp. TaxID=1706381 RepID=UPI0030DB965D
MMNLRSIVSCLRSLSSLVFNDFRHGLNECLEGELVNHLVRISLPDLVTRSM